jgi:deoxycytidylate deaminase
MQKAPMQKSRTKHLPGKGSTLYVVRIGRVSTIKNSAPCLKCAETIRRFGIERIIYSSGDDVYTSVDTSDYFTDKVCSGTRWLDAL